MADEEWIGTTFIIIIQTSLPLKMPVHPPLSNLLKKHKEKTIATLMNKRCDMWHVKFVCKENGKRVYIKGKGWEKFTKDNSLEKGYILEVEYKGNLIFMVRIYDHSTCEKVCVSSSESDDDHSNEILNRIDVHNPKKMTMLQKMKQRVSLGHKLVLKRTIKKWNFSHGFLRLPAWFAILSGVKRDHDKMIIENPNGKRWQVGISHPKTSRGILVSQRWGKLARSSGLKHGSKIELEWVPNEQAGDNIVHLRMHKL